MHSQSVWVVYYITLWDGLIRVLDGFGLGAPPATQPCKERSSNHSRSRSPYSRVCTPGLCLWISVPQAGYIYIIIVRAGWTGSQPWASPSALASCRQGRGLDANRVTVMVVLATRRRLAPCWSADEHSLRPSHSCTRRARVRYPSHVSVCELKKLGRAVRL